MKYTKGPAGKDSSPVLPDLQLAGLSPVFPLSGIEFVFLHGIGGNL